MQKDEESVAEQNKKRKRDDADEIEKIQQQRKKQKIENLNEQIKKKQIDLKTAESLIDDGNKFLQKCLNDKVLKRKSMMEAQAKISIGLQKCSEIKSELSSLIKERDEFSTKH